MAEAPAAEEAGFRWPAGQRAAVSLTYDDSVPVHHERVAPRLTELGLRATFYLSAGHAFTADPLAWRPVAEAGHELGNHTLFHPCRRDANNADWVRPYYDLKAYTPERWEDEVRVANAMLKLVDGEAERTFGNTCCVTELGPDDDRVSLSPLIAKHFVAGRGPFNETVVTPERLDYRALGHFGTDGRTFAEIQPWIDEAIERGGWTVIMTHGVGEGTHGLFIADAEHEKMLAYLAARKAEVWTAPVVDVAKHLKAEGYGGEGP